MRLSVGIGCRRGVGAQAVEAAIQQALIALQSTLLMGQQVGATRSQAYIEHIATIDAKADEAGVVSFCASHGLPLKFFSAAQLAALTSSAPPSAAVQQRFGIDNVCEAAALAAAPGGHLLLAKALFGDVTVAIAASAANAVPTDTTSS